MSTVIERLEALAALTPEGDFERVTGHKPNPDSWADQREMKWHASDIDRWVSASARQALPDLLQAVRVLAAEGCDESGTTTERCWDQPGAGAEPGMVNSTGWSRDQWCSRCRALEPLLREEGQG